MRYTNLRFTYLLTYGQTNGRWHIARFAYVLLRANSESHTWY